MVMSVTGMLYDVSSKKTAFYHRDMKASGRITVAGPGLDSLPIPPEVHLMVCLTPPPKPTSIDPHSCLPRAHRAWLFLRVCPKGPAEYSVCWHACHEVALSATSFSVPHAPMQSHTACAL